MIDLQASLISNYRPKKEMEFTRTRENRQEMKNRAFQIVARNLLEEQQRERDKVPEVTNKEVLFTYSDYLRIITNFLLYRK